MANQTAWPCSAAYLLEAWSGGAKRKEHAMLTLAALSSSW